MDSRNEKSSKMDMKSSLPDNGLKEIYKVSFKAPPPSEDGRKGRKNTPFEEVRKKTTRAELNGPLLAATRSVPAVTSLSLKYKEREVSTMRRTRSEENRLLLASSTRKNSFVSLESSNTSSSRRCSGIDLIFPGAGDLSVLETEPQTGNEFCEHKSQTENEAFERGSVNPHTGDLSEVNERKSHSLMKVLSRGRQ